MACLTASFGTTRCLKGARLKLPQCRNRGVLRGAPVALVVLDREKMLVIMKMFLPDLRIDGE